MAAAAMGDQTSVTHTRYTYVMRHRRHCRAMLNIKMLETEQHASDESWV